MTTSRYICVPVNLFYFILLNMENTDRDILRSATARKRWMVVQYMACIVRNRCFSAEFKIVAYKSVLPSILLYRKEVLYIVRNINVN